MKLKIFRTIEEIRQFRTENPNYDGICAVDKRIYKPLNLTDVYFSLEALESLKEWSYDELDR